jgi:ubiquinone/menaquinone biosynthesis C-methylase UbiE
MTQHPGHGHRFSQIERLRSPERVAHLLIPQVVEAVLRGCSAETLLDVGTGSALFGEAFAQKGLAVAGIDVNPRMLAAARLYLPEADLKQGAAEAIPFPDNAFDIVFMGLVLHETDDLLKALQEAQRVARSCVAVLEWPYRSTDFGPGIEERLSPDEIESVRKSANLSEITATYFENLVLYLMETNKILNG